MIVVLSKYEETAPDSNVESSVLIMSSPITNNIVLGRGGRRGEVRGKRDRGCRKGRELNIFL